VELCCVYYWMGSSSWPIVGSMVGGPLTCLARGQVHATLCRVPVERFCWWAEVSANLWRLCIGVDLAVLLGRVDLSRVGVCVLFEAVCWEVLPLTLCVFIRTVVLKGIAHTVHLPVWWRDLALHASVWHMRMQPGFAAV
jgi:hypothetical protein